MITNQINSYAFSSASNTLNQKTNATSDGTSTPTVSKGSSLDMNDFMQLLAAQFTNQDVMNPSDSTEYVSQMAQFAALQAMQDVSQVTSTQYGASLVGKKVVVASYNSAGKYVEDTGVVDSINFASDPSVVVVNGKAYNLSSVMEVVNPTAATTPDNKSGTPDETTPDDTSGSSGETV
nr:flagellar hook capping FlgD N-terminal domain-containing protein [uncultured Caproiciproducens sp.]